MFRKNVAGQVIHFQGVDSATGGIKSGVTWTVRRCIDGTFAAGGGTVTEDGTTGWYKYVMSQADTNGNNIGFNFTGTGAIPQTVNIITTAADPTDAVRLGLTALPNANAEAAGGLYTRGTGAGQINQPANGMVDANVVRNAGTAITAASGVQEVKVQSVATDAINADAIAVDAIGGSELAATAASEIASAVRTELTTELGRVDVAVSTRSSHSVADIWNALTSGMSTAGSIGKRIVDFLTGDIFARLGAPAGASISADIAAVKSDTGAIKTKTDNLPTDPADASDIAAAFGTVNSTLATIVGHIDTEIADIKAKTDNLPSDPADASDIAASFSTVNTKLDTIDDFLDTEVAAIKAKTDNLPASPAATSDIPTASAIADQVWDETQSEHTSPDTTGSTINTTLSAVGVVSTQIAGNLRINGFKAGSSVFVIKGGTISPTQQGESVVVITALAIDYDNQFQHMLLAISDTNTGMDFVAEIKSSDATANTFTLSHPLPDIGAEDAISFVLLPAGMGDASKALVLYEGN